MKYLKSFYGLPKKIIFCEECVISNQRPNSTVEMKNKGNKKDAISFSKKNICSACKYSKIKKKINWKIREKKLFKLLENYRKNNGDYDVLVPSSGGKDSSFAAHILKNKYKMNPLTITWSPNMPTDIGIENQKNLTVIGGIDNILYTPNGILHKYLTKLAFENLGHPLQPFIHGQKIIGPKIADKFNIKLIMYGENQAEYGNPLDDNKDPFMSTDFYSIDNFKKILLGGYSIEEILKSTKFKYSEFSSYFPPTIENIYDKELKVSYLGFFEKWDPQECYYYSVDNTGFKPSRERSIGTYSRYTEIDDKIIPLHFYMTYIKFGIGRATYDASQEIRNKKITRSEGAYLVTKFDHEFPTKYFDEYLDYFSMGKDKFYKTIDKFRSPHLWKKVGRKWYLRHNVSRTGIDD